MEDNVIRPNLMYLHEDHIDVPTWRKWLIENRHYFNKVVIYITPKNLRGISFEPFLKSFFQPYNITFMKLPTNFSYYTEDWRDKATHDMLNVFDDDWFVSLEQDLFIYNDQLLPTIFTNKVNDIPLSYDEYGLGNPIQVCPTFCMIKKSQLESLDVQDYGAWPRLNVRQETGAPLEADHWSRVVMELQEKYGYENMNSYGFTKGIDFEHMGFVGHNFTYMRFPNEFTLCGKESRFAKFLKDQIDCPIEKPQGLLKLITPYYEKYKHTLES